LAALSRFHRRQKHEQIGEEAKHSARETQDDRNDKVPLGLCLVLHLLVHGKLGMQLVSHLVEQALLRFRDAGMQYFFL